MYTVIRFDDVDVPLNLVYAYVYSIHSQNLHSFNKVHCGITQSL